MLEKSFDYIYVSFNEHNKLINEITGRDNFEELTFDDIMKIRDDFNLEDRIKNDKIRKDNNYYFQFLTTLKYDKDKQEFYLEHSTKSWMNLIEELIRKNILENISKII
jgi:hypothetical protein